MAQVYYAFENATYKHYLFGEQKILQFNTYGKECKEIPYAYIPVMRFMVPVNVISILMCTDGSNIQLELAYNCAGIFGKLLLTQDKLFKCAQLRSNKNCIATLERRISAGVSQSIHVFNKFETSIFNDVQKGVF